jgi:diadenosine tetraphosphate (Ap4A) HIT family hydrolase
MTCEACDRIAANERGENPFAIVRLTTGYVVLHPTQYFRGYTLFVARTCAPELHALERDERDEFLREMAEVAHAVARACNPRKLNYELLGNGVPHLHWHLFPRYDTDPHPGGPVWEDLNFLRNLWSEGAQLSDGDRDDLRRALLRELEVADVTVERAFVSPP